MLGVLADAHDLALALDDLAFFAHGLDTGTHFHRLSSLVMQDGVSYLERQVIRPRVRS